MAYDPDVAITLWPEYFDKGLTRAQGRRLPKDICVAKPDLDMIAKGAMLLDLEYEVREDMSYPKAPREKHGCVKVEKGTDGRGCGAVGRFVEEVAVAFCKQREELFLFLLVCHLVLSLFGFFVKSVLLAELAVFLHLNTIRIVFLVLHRIVVSLLAFRAGQGNLYSHVEFPPFTSNFKLCAGSPAK